MDLLKKHQVFLKKLKWILKTYSRVLITRKHLIKNEYRNELI